MHLINVEKRKRLCVARARLCVCVWRGGGGCWLTREIKDRNLGRVDRVRSVKHCLYHFTTDDPTAHGTLNDFTMLLILSVPPNQIV